MRFNPKFAVPSIMGVVALGTGIAFSSIGVVSASHASPDKKNCASAGACQTYTNSEPGAGVAGVSTSTGSQSNYLIGAVSGTAEGVDNGVFGSSASRNGGFFTNATAGYYTLYAYGTESGAYPFAAYGPGGGVSIDPSGDGSFTGYVEATSFETDIKTRGGVLRGYGVQSTQSRIEDTGTGQMIGGRGSVSIDAAFGRTIDFRGGYQVFITPGGDSHGLFVTNKSPAGFEVRESMGGRSNLSFDYRIVAHPIGTNFERLPTVKPLIMDRLHLGHVPQ